ncbi:hypothetical protein OL233_07780 [Vagococcus sp. PNs007]|uniref:Uncharacterized protein n=1 Tax=Vagococcus proximus TaxID=2991417 RepID=A0ABT5X2U4_9ENTE|nr:hypothetical protein [Vagococcus proximus]MDF0480191.1 hypothetical protein [Vagococcus proximus]
MARIIINLERYLSERELAINYLMYDYAKQEPLIPGEKVTMLSSNDGPYFSAPGRFDFYNQEGQLYVMDKSIEEFEKLLPELLKELPEPLTFEVEDLEGIISLVKSAQEVGYSVYGYHQKLVDTWDVIDPLSLIQDTTEKAEKGEHFNPTSYYTASQEDDRLTLVNNVGTKLLCESDEMKTRFLLENYYFEVVDSKGECLLKQIPLEELAGVLYSLLNGMTVSEVKNLFLSPYNMTRNQVEECLLVYDRYTMSKKRKIETLDDFSALESVPLDSDYQGYYGEYSYWLEEECIRISRSVDVMDLPKVFELLNMEKQEVLVGLGANKVSDKLLSDAIESDILIFRDDRIQTRVCDTSELEYEEGTIVNFIYEERKNEISLSTFRETLFTAIDQETREELFRELTFSQSVARLIRLWEERDK